MVPLGIYRNGKATYTFHLGAHVLFQDAENDELQIVPLENEMNEHAIATFHRFSSPSYSHIHYGHV